MTDKKDLKIAVVGAGSWGTAIANLLGSKGFKTDLWVYEKQVKDQILTCKENKTFLSGIKLSENICPYDDLKKTISDKDLIVFVVPSHVMRIVTMQASKFISKDCVLVSASKGIEAKTHLTMTGIIAENIPNVSKDYIGVLSGPSFAREVAKRVPTTVTAASVNLKTAEFIQKVFTTDYFRVYISKDPIGVEVGGAAKNIIAIGAGIVDGMGLGLNTRAAIITRGLAEIRKIGLKLGADKMTFSGLSGMGDLVLTCTGALSRNHKVGLKIGKGKGLSDILAEMKTVAEGVKTTRSVYNLSKELDVNVPIITEIYNILYEDALPADALKRLMKIELSHEI